MLRSTFRSPQHSTAWQRQLRDRYLSEGTPPVPHLDVKRAVVRRVSRKLAAQIILKYEWLGTMASTGYHYGIFYGEYCAGVCCAGVSCTGGAMSNRTFGIESNEMQVLARGACVHWAPPGTNSKLIAWTCRLLGRNTNAKLVIAYSDTDAGEVGTVYQACNWTYIGFGGSTQEWVAPNGRIYNQMLPRDLARRKGGMRLQWVAALKKAGWHEQGSNPKHRYVYILDRSDKALSDRIERMKQPYPKRAGSILADATAIHAVEDGAAPIPALHEVST